MLRSFFSTSTPLSKIHSSWLTVVSNSSILRRISIVLHDSVGYSLYRWKCITEGINRYRFYRGRYSSVVDHIVCIIYVLINIIIKYFEVFPEVRLRRYSALPCRGHLPFTMIYLITVLCVVIWIVLYFYMCIVFV